jgi:AraC-like DNA-binding protein
MSETSAELRHWRVSAALAPYVSSMTAYDVRQPSPGQHRGLPTTELTFVLPLGEPIDVAWAGSPESRGRRWSCVSGLHLAPADIHHDGSQLGVQLGLTASGARALLGMPASALAAQLATLEEVSPRLARLPDDLSTAGSWRGRLLRVEAALLDVLRRRDPKEIRPELARAMARLTRGVPVGAVADEVGYSRRHLSTLLAAEVGLTPKQYQRLARFQASRSCVVSAATAGRPLADAAAASGYADQAHLTREWTALAGCAPGAWLREEFPFLQATEGAGAAS